MPPQAIERTSAVLPLKRHDSAPVVASVKYESSRWFFTTSAFHGPVDGITAENCLREKKPGAFLLRQTSLRISDQNVHGGIVSMMTKHGVVHKSLTSDMDESAILALVAKNTGCTATPVAPLRKKGPLVIGRRGSLDSGLMPITVDASLKKSDRASVMGPVPLMPASVRSKCCFEKALNHATARGITLSQLFERCIPRTVATNFSEQAFADVSKWSTPQFAMYQEALRMWTLSGTASSNNPKASFNKAPEGSALLYPVKGTPGHFSLFVNERDMTVVSPVPRGTVILNPGETVSDAMVRLHPHLFPVKPRKKALTLEELKQAYEASEKHLGNGNLGSVRECVLGDETIAIKASKPTRTLIKQNVVRNGSHNLDANNVAFAAEMLAWELIASSKLYGIPGVAPVSDYAIENAANIASLDEKLSPTVYMAMPLLTDGTLKKTVGLTPIKAAEIARRISVTLARMHARGISHRDLKPENVGKDGTLIDFGFVSDESTAPGSTPKRLPGSGGYSSSRRLDRTLQVSQIPLEDVFGLAMLTAQISCYFTDGFIEKYGKYHIPVFAYAHAHKMYDAQGNLDWQKSTHQFTPEAFTSYLEETMTEGVGKSELIALLARAVHTDLGVVPTAAEMAHELTRLVALAH